MLTKTQFCKMIINDFKETEKLKDIDNSQLENYIYMSSSLCVALEYLGLLKDKQAIEYARTRGGVLFSYLNVEEKDHGIISMRELLSFLPDKIEED